MFYDETMNDKPIKLRLLVKQVKSKLIIRVWPQLIGLKEYNTNESLVRWKFQ